MSELSKPQPSLSELSSWVVKEREAADPLFRDLSEKKLSFRRNVVSLAAELKELRRRLDAKEQLFAKEARMRQEAEAKVKKIQEELHRLQDLVEEKNEQLLSLASTTQQYLKELDDARSKLSETQAAADESVASAQSLWFQCLSLIKELDDKNSSLRENETRVARLAEQLRLLQKDLQTRELIQNQLRDEVGIVREVIQAVSRAGINDDSDFLRLVNKTALSDSETMNRLMARKDEEIEKLKDEIKNISTHWMLKTKELESQIEKQKKADQDLKKRVLKLEICLQDSRCQTRKLQKMGERRDMAMKELKRQLSTKEQNSSHNNEKQNFWESSSFKIVISVSMLLLVVFSKR